MHSVKGICMRHLVIAFSFLLIFAYTSEIQADVQDIVIKGKVLNKDKEPMIGATVTVNKHKSGAVVDMDGNYSIQLKSVKFPCTLIVQYVGYKTARITVNSYREARNTRIFLEEDNYSLDDVVVVGYGKSSRKKLTGAVAKVTSSVIAQATHDAPIMALQGNASGVYIEQGSGVPGSGSTNLIIRGVSTLSSQSEPLYIIDGIPFNANGNVGNLGGGGMMNRSRDNAVGPSSIGIFGQPDALSLINPADIESIEILKDADATAIYGTKGANGVVLITTKKGQTGKVKVQANYATTASYVGKRLDFLGVEDYIALRKKAVAYDLEKGYITKDDYNAVNYPDLLLWDQHKDYNWQDSMLGETSWGHDAQLQISGGNKNTAFMVSGSYYTANTVVMSSDRYNRWSTRANISHHTDDNRFKVEAGFTFSKIDMLAKGGQSPYFYLNTAPNTPILDEEGRPYYIPGDKDYSSNSRFLAFTGESETASFIGNYMMSYEIINNLTAKVTAGYNYTSTDQANKYERYYNNPFDESRYNFADYYAMDTQTFQVEPQLLYDFTVSKAKFSALLGATYSISNYIKQQMRGSKFPSDDFLDDITSAAEISNVRNPQRQSKTASIFARLNMDWDNKYLLSGIFRRDGSSRFGPGNRFGNFYSIGAAWLFSNENFIKETAATDILSHGKLRFSYGRTGNDGIGDFKYMSSYSTTSYPYEGNIGMYPATIGNKDLHWESTYKMDLGLELGFFNDRALFNVTWFRNISTDLLTNINVAAQSGFTSYPTNLDAEILNRGWEIELNTQNIKTRNFMWKTSFNITVPHNELTKYKDLEKSSDSRWYAIGHSLDVIKGYNYLGLDVQTGMPQFEDINGDGKIDNTSDYQILGHQDPKFYGGLNNSFTYKGFTLDVNLYFRHKPMQTGYLWRYMYPVGMGYNVTEEMANNYWSTPGVDAKYPPLASSEASPIYRQFRNYLSYSQSAYSKASYLRLRDVTLSYNFPAKCLSRMNLSALRMYVQGKNLFTITKYDSFDPETGDGGVPSLTSWVLGLNLTF